MLYAVAYIYFPLKNFYIFIVLFLLFFITLICDDREYYISYCQEDNTNLLNDENCFNNLLIFKHKNYQVNNFAKNKNGDFVVEFTEYTEYDELSSSRLFYGLTKDGQNFFSNESSYNREFNIDIDEETYYENIYFNLDGIYDSKSLFVSIWNSSTFFFEIKNIY